MNDPMPRREFLRRTAVFGAALSGAPALSRLFAADTAAPADLAIVEGSDYFAATIRAVEFLGGISRFVKPGARVGLLINAPRWWTKPGSFTSPEVSLAAVKLCADAGAREIVGILNLQPGYWSRSPRAAGLGKELALVKPNAGAWTEVEIPKGLVLKKALVNQALLDCDVFINLPISKNHEGTGFTGCLKNMMGACNGSTNRSCHGASGDGYGDVPRPVAGHRRHEPDPEARSLHLRLDRVPAHERPGRAGRNPQGAPGRRRCGSGRRGRLRV